MAFIPLTEDQWVFCQILYKRISHLLELLKINTAAVILIQKRQTHCPETKFLNAHRFPFFINTSCTDNMYCRLPLQDR